jgi:hypothetical protein
MMTDGDMRDQVIAALGDQAGNYQVDRIAEEIQQRYGTVDVNVIEPEKFWEIVSEGLRP